jgi:hypothetical protein
MDSSLSNQYNSLLNEYKQTYKQYLICLQDSSVNMVSVPNTFFWGESPLRNDSLNSVDDCLQSCSSTTFCSGATFNKNKNLCSLRKGPGSIIPSKNKNNYDFAIVPSPLYYSYQLKNINQNLLDLNKQMMNSLQQSYSSYQENNQQQQQNHVILIEKNHSYLKEDRGKIEQMIKEEELMNAANENSQLVVKQHYYAYIIYLFVTILLILVFIRVMFMNGLEQRGGLNYKKK